MTTTTLFQALVQTFRDHDEYVVLERGIEDRVYILHRQDHARQNRTASDGYVSACVLPANTDMVVPWENAGNVVRREIDMTHPDCVDRFQRAVKSGCTDVWVSATIKRVFGNQKWRT